jgi:hypothetical protein
LRWSVARRRGSGHDIAVPTSIANKALAGAIMVAATLGLAGCSTPATSPVSRPQPATTQSRPEPRTSTVADSPATTRQAACPVDAATLEKAFKANTALASAIVLGGGLTRITCYQGYAVAHTTPTNVDPALVLFVYDQTTHTWAAVTAGTAVRCGQYVPPAVVPHLPGCAS